MNLTSLQYFKAVADEMSFSRAAEKCYVSQQAISQHINKLEKNYNIKLFIRSPQLMLTPAGELLYNYTVKMLYEEKLLNEQIRDICNELAGVVTIGMSASKNSRIIPTVFQRFHSEYPHVLLRFIDGATKDLINMLLNREVDFIVITSEVNDSGITYKELCGQAIMLFVHKEVILEYCDNPTELFQLNEQSVSIKFFQNCPFLLYPPGYRVRRTVDPIFNSLHITPKTIIETGNPYALERLVYQKAGAAFIPREAVSDSLLTDSPANDIYRYKVEGILSQNATKIYFHRDMYFPIYSTDLIKMLQIALNK